MKVEVQPQVNTESTYPYIGIACAGEDNEIIILFTSLNAGVCIKSRYNSAGAYSEKWSEYRYTPFTGTVTLSND